ncbi:hypothetical protein D1872_270050 [compost metagenome]
MIFGILGIGVIRNRFSFADIMQEGTDRQVLQLPLIQTEVKPDHRRNQTYVHRVQICRIVRRPNLR